MNTTVYMKYLAVLLIGVVIGSICCINTSKRVPSKEPNPIAADAIDYHTANMHYKVFISPEGAIFAINVTKDSLLCAKITYDRHQN